MGAMLATMMAMSVFLSDCLTDDECATMGVLPEEREMLNCINHNLSTEQLPRAFRMDPDCLTHIEGVSKKCRL